MLPGLAPTAPDAPAEPHSPVQQAASPERIILTVLSPQTRPE
jgi:hypothetical protein